MERSAAGRKIEDLILPITGIWFCIFLTEVFIYSFTEAAPIGTESGRGLGFVLLMGIPFIPGLILLIVSRFFSYVRTYHCHYCKVTSEFLLDVKIGEHVKDQPLLESAKKSNSAIEREMKMRRNGRFRDK